MPPSSVATTVCCDCSTINFCWCHPANANACHLWDTDHVSVHHDTLRRGVYATSHHSRGLQGNPVEGHFSNTSCDVWRSLWGRISQGCDRVQEQQGQDRGDGRGATGATEEEPALPQVSGAHEIAECPMWPTGPCSSALSRVACPSIFCVLHRVLVLYPLDACFCAGTHAQKQRNHHAQMTQHPRTHPLTHARHIHRHTMHLRYEKKLASVDLSNPDVLKGKELPPPDMDPAVAQLFMPKGIKPATGRLAADRDPSIKARLTHRPPSLLLFSCYSKHSISSISLFLALFRDWVVWPVAPSTA